MANDEARQLVDSLCASLQGNIASLDALQGLLEPVLACFQLVEPSLSPPSSGSINGSNAERWQALTDENKAYILRTSFSDIQRVLATKIVVDWHHQLSATAVNGNLLQKLWKPFFCPSTPTSTEASPYAVQVALSAYPVLLEIVANKPTRLQGLSSVQIKPTPLHPLVLSTATATLADLSQSFNTRIVFQYYLQNPTSRTLLDWQAFVNLYTSIPTRIANLPSATSRSEIDSRLEWRTFFLRLSRDTEILFGESDSQEIRIQSLSFLLSKLIKSGFLQPSPGYSSFWPAIWQPLQTRLISTSASAQDIASASRNWQTCLANLISSDLATFASTFFVHCQNLLEVSDGDMQAKLVKRFAVLAMRIFANFNAEGTEMVWDILVKSILLERQIWQEEMARMLVAWAALSDEQDGQHEAACRLIDLVLPLWADRSVVEKGSESYHACKLPLLCLIVSKTDIKLSSRRSQHDSLPRVGTSSNPSPQHHLTIPLAGFPQIDYYSSLLLEARSQAIRHVYCRTSFSEELGSTRDRESS
jgi:hypothetical protein